MRSRWRTDRRRDGGWQGSPAVDPRGGLEVVPVEEVVGQVLRNEPITSTKRGKEVNAVDVARAVELLLTVDALAMTGQAFNCYDQYVAEEHVARIAKELTGSRSEIADVNRGPKHQIDTQKIRALGMSFGGEELLRATVRELVEAHRSGQDVRERH